MADSSFRDGDARASSLIAAPTGNGSVHIQKVQQVAADGTALSTTSGNAVTVADGADVTQGAKADAAYTGSGSPTVVSILKGLWSSFFGVAAGATDSNNPVKVGGYATTTPSAVTSGQRQNLWLGLAGQAVIGTIVATGTDAQPNNSLGGIPNISTNTSLPLITAGFVFNGTSWDRSRGDTNGNYTVAKPVTTGGLSVSRLIAATSGVIKASAGQLYTGLFTNSNAAIRYLQIYNKATAGTLSTDTPVITVPLPPNVSVMIDFSAIGGAFATGISWQFTTDDIAIPTTAGATTDIHGFVTFK